MVETEAEGLLAGREYQHRAAEYDESGWSLQHKQRGVSERRNKRRRVAGAGDDLMAWGGTMLST